MSNYLVSLKKTLEANNFEVYLAEDRKAALGIFQNEILPSLMSKVVSYADSESLKVCGLLDVVRNNPQYDVIETFDPELSWKEIIYRRKEALLADLFLTGTNALTEKGQLVNLDMIGNRVSALLFGPRNVVLTIGRNKIVKDLDAAFSRIRNHAAPLNAQRHPDLKTPCQKTGRCHDCKSPHRICNAWTITEKSYPKGRIKIILIDEDLGL